MALFGLFGSKNEGGMMDVIRCDEPEYLVWKWRPNGQPANSTRKENNIRWGSSLRVKDGEVAVFVYKQKGGPMHEYIVGPFDQKISTDNFPVLSSILGIAYQGNSPFQAEVYFINLAGNVQMRFAVPYFDVFDPRFMDFSVPVAVRGSITFNLTDYQNFIKLHRLIDFDLERFKLEVKDAVIKYIKNFVTNAPSQLGIPVLQLERQTLQINDAIQQSLTPIFQNDFGVNLKRLDISAIDPNKDTENYKQLQRVTAAQSEKLINAKTDIEITNLSESMRIQREEAQRAQRLQTESNYMGVHALNQQADVLKANAAGMASGGTSDGGGMGINAAGMMTSMMMGQAMGSQMANMMNQMGQQSTMSSNTPPPSPGTSLYNISVNGQTSGPFPIAQLQQMAQAGQFTANTYVWKQGMANWELASNIAELQFLFGAVPPAPPTGAKQKKSSSENKKKETSSKKEEGKRKEKNKPEIVVATEKTKEEIEKEKAAKLKEKEIKLKEKEKAAKLKDKAAKLKEKEAKLKEKEKAAKLKEKAAKLKEKEKKAKEKK
ncbi:MAG: SPFH domain-containing protein [Paludibacteraceae bacterium]|nr:SPFH domain-containing protein [Paludibacteraceae bacterium]